VSLNKLYFDSSLLVYEDGVVKVSPHFLCPVCSGRPASWLEWSKRVNIKKTVDTNELYTFTLPCCNTPISLYIAIHKTKDLDDLTCSISTQPILEEWWVWEET
jgi:hypothetical protein